MILKDRVAIVTAAGSGIGRAGAEIMGREGAIVIATDLRAERAEETARRIRDAGGRAEGRALDVTRDTDIERLIDYAASAHGRIDILHNHACIQVEGSLEQVPAKLYEYFRARRPILGLADPSGDTGRVMRESGVAHIAQGGTWRGIWWAGAMAS